MKKTSKKQTAPSKATIFVQIPSYRDPELLPTIRDCISKAKYPNRLNFGLCWQRDESESLEEFADHPRFKIYECPWRDAEGLLWARHTVRKFYDGEDYSLQLDSHHRFEQDWDVTLITMLRDLQKKGHKKPLITAYAARYTPANAPDNKTGADILMDTDRPMRMVADKFTAGGTVLFRPNHIHDPEDLKAPVPARWVSGHFYFTLGRHCEDYIYDPHMYFAGDEMALSVRSFTAGYDLFHPHKVVVYHEYTREYRDHKHWGDHSTALAEKKEIDKAWHVRNLESLARLRQLTGQEDGGIDLGEYGLGKERTLKDFEEYAGINYAKRLLHPATRSGKNPPTGLVSESDTEQNREIRVVWDVAYLRGVAKTHKIDWIYLGVEDDTGKVLFRTDLNKKNYPALFNMEQSAVKLQFASSEEPYKWVLWPVDKKGNWVERYDELIPNGKQKILETVNSLDLSRKERQAVKKGLQEAKEI